MGNIVSESAILSPLSSQICLKDGEFGDRPVTQHVHISCLLVYVYSDLYVDFYCAKKGRVGLDPNKPEL